MHTEHETLARKIAGDTLADVRTVRRVLRGERVRGIVGERIRAALANYDVAALTAPPTGVESVAADLARRRALTRVVRGETPADGTPPTIAERITACRALDLAEATDAAAESAQQEST